MISTIAVGTDGSGTATEAVRMAADIARRFGAKLVLVSVFRAKGEPVDRSGASIELQWATSPLARVREILARSEADLRREGIECSTLVDGGRSGRGARAPRDGVRGRPSRDRQQGNASPRARQRPQHGHSQGAMLGLGRQTT